MARFAVLGGNVALANLYDAHVSIGDAVARGGVEGIQSKIFHD